MSLSGTRAREQRRDGQDELGVLGLCIAASAPRRARRLRPPRIRGLAGLTRRLRQRAVDYTSALHVRHRIQPSRGSLRQDLDFPELEERTKIRPKYLRALEDERFDILPAPTYVRGFLRSYAEALGLDGQPFVDEYHSRFTVGEDDAAASRPTRARSAPRPRPRGSRGWLPSRSWRLRSRRRS